MTQDPSQHQPPDPHGGQPQSPPDDGTSVGSHYVQAGYEQPGPYHPPGYQQYVQAGYEQYPPPGAYYSPPGQSAAQSNQALSVTALVLGICSIATTFCCLGGGLLPAIIAMICGGIGVSKANKGEGGGRGMALGGFITGVIGVVLNVLFMIFIIFMGMAESTLYDNSS